MLSPKKIKWRKQQRGSMKGTATAGSSISFGDYALKALEPGWITARQIEAARVAISRAAKKGGKLWIRMFPDKPVTKKPTEVRMGKGKGPLEFWAAPVRTGRILYEMNAINEEVAKKALKLAASKLPIKTKIVVKEGVQNAEG